MPGISTVEGSPVYRAICKQKQPISVQSSFKINPKAFAIICQMACYSQAPGSNKKIQNVLRLRKAEFDRSIYITQKGLLHFTTKSFFNHILQSVIH